MHKQFWHSRCGRTGKTLTFSGVRKRWRGMKIGVGEGEGYVKPILGEVGRGDGDELLGCGGWGEGWS